MNDNKRKYTGKGIGIDMRGRILSTMLVLGCTTLIAAAPVLYPLTVYAEEAAQPQEEPAQSLEETAAPETTETGAPAETPAQTTAVSGQIVFTGTQTFPEAITINLLANNVVSNTIVVNSETKWAFAFNNLPLTDANGAPIVYTLEEVAPEGFVVTIDGTTITNTWAESIKTEEEKKTGEQPAPAEQAQQAEPAPEQPAPAEQAQQATEQPAAAGQSAPDEQALKAAEEANAAARKAEEDAAAAMKEAEEAKKDAEEAKKTAEEAKKAAEKAEKKAEEAKRAADEADNDPEKVKKAEERAKKAEKAKKEAEEKAKKAEKAKKKAEEKAKKAEETRKIAEEKKNTAAPAQNKVTSASAKAQALAAAEQKYHYVNVKYVQRDANSSDFILANYRSQITEQAVNGYHYVGFIPAELNASGAMISIDLVFEKD